ncbi:hypothetical protein FSP39_017774 [Pinctada imbricata]|uniref:Uncharacterized protein n=1 Tax=Pinctada imbricata TaxID=66713 RepID=A0AA88YF79_PINIB|nr:hypothetical protein FSP39_017774 [Pinctada imbricata]
MNDAISQLQRRGKKKSRLEQLLLVDHSNIYFENERLAEKLAKYLDELQREKHLLLMQHESERRELEEQIESLLSMKKISAEKTKILLEKLDSFVRPTIQLPKPDKKVRPHTTGSYFKRSRPKSEERDKSGRQQVDVHAKSLSDYEDEGGESRKREKRKSRSEAEDSKEGEKKQRKYPAHYYNSVIQADDNCLRQMRNDFRRQQTAPNLFFGRERSNADGMKKQPTAPGTAIGSRKGSTSAIGSRKNSNAQEDVSDNQSRMKLLCTRKSKPVMMSLRQMKELTNLDSESDAIAKRHKEKIERYLQDNQEKFDALTVRMKSFLKEVDAKIAKDTDDAKEKEVEKDDMYFGILPPDQT